jgi:phosphatidylethanolamine-binding protein (PEBP) family uncharacterized protein
MFWRNSSPQLNWSNAPKERRVPILMYDPDAPTGSGFGIGLFFDIPANVSELVKKRW